MSNQQMIFEKHNYPVDRYLVESSKRVEMVNVIDDDIWNSDPTLRPEDEITLRKLHEMLQSTTYDLKQLSTELSEVNKPSVFVKTLPTPLDDEFNEKVHIEQIVNAKFHGYKVIDKLSHFNKHDEKNTLKKINTINTGVQTNFKPVVNPLLNENIGLIRGNIAENKEKQVNSNKSCGNQISNKVVKNKPTVAYEEVSSTYVIKKDPQKKLHTQEMPCINIRSELINQKVLQLDILPEDAQCNKDNGARRNISVVTLKHSTDSDTKPQNRKEFDYGIVTKTDKSVPVRKFSKLPTGVSTESTEDDISQSMHKCSKSIDRSNSSKVKIENYNHITQNVNKSLNKPHSPTEWRKKLKSVYGKTSNFRKVKLNKTIKLKNNTNASSAGFSYSNNKKMLLNNAEYIPYSKLTLGGAHLRDIENEMSKMPHDHDMPLSPLLDKILSSQENTFSNEFSRNNVGHSDKNIFTASDENLLQEVLDIEKTVSDTLAKNNEAKSEVPIDNQFDGVKISKYTYESSAKVVSDNDSYDDDFEDDNTNDFSNSYKRDSDSDKSSKKNNANSSEENYNDEVKNDNNLKSPFVKQNIPKSLAKLSLRNSVEVFEFVHSVDKRDNAIQSNTDYMICLKETQTSPRDGGSVSPPIRNVLWPIDPKRKLEGMFDSEKDVIRKLIAEEYTDIIQKISKPSTSKDTGKQEQNSNNIACYQKNTQTSPARVKNVTTSPTKTKTRTTSPLAVALSVDRHISPTVMVNNNEQTKVEVENEVDDLGVSINLSSPRFSLRLPQSSREVLSNVEPGNLFRSAIDKENNKSERKTVSKNMYTSSSSIEGYYSSSEQSSLGEIKAKLKRTLRNKKVALLDISYSSTNSVFSSDCQSGEIVPLRSEGEIDAGIIIGDNVNKSNKDSKSEGEVRYEL